MWLFERMPPVSELAILPTYHRPLERCEDRVPCYRRHRISALYRVQSRSRLSRRAGFRSRGAGIQEGWPGRKIENVIYGSRIERLADIRLLEGEARFVSIRCFRFQQLPVERLTTPRTEWPSPGSRSVR